MTSLRHSQYPHLPPLEGSHDRQVYLHPFFPAPETSSAGFLSLCQGSRSCETDHRDSDHHQQQGIESSSNNNKEESGPSSCGSAKWVSSKMRFMRKMVNSNETVVSKTRKTELQVLQDQQQSIGRTNNGVCLPNSAPVRVCSDCNTTKTPLWRSGPRGPKSLCNACGIRQRKARRAMAEAAAQSNGGLIPAVAPAKVPKEKEQQHGVVCTVPFKKRCKFSTAGETGEKLIHGVEEFTIGFSKSSAFHRVFPQDEKDAAMLLMALSCGLIRG